MVSPETTKFLVWRTYNRLIDELDRIPTTQEIGDEIDMSGSLVRYYMVKLGLKTRENGVNLKPYEYVEHIPDVLEMMEGLGDD